MDQTAEPTTAEHTESDENGATIVRNMPTSDEHPVQSVSSDKEPDVDKSDDKDIISPITSESDNLKSLDAALDNLSAQVSELLNTSPVSPSDSVEAPLDDAISHLNAEVLDLLKESRKIQDELQQSEKERKVTLLTKHVSSDIEQADDVIALKSDDVPPHPLNTYRWEDIRRDKEKGGYPWTYLHPQENDEAGGIQSEQSITISPIEQPEQEEHLMPDVAQSKFLSALLNPNPNPNVRSDPFVFNFGNIEAQHALDSYSCKSSVKNSSSGILEVLHELEAGDENEAEKSRQLKNSSAQSHQDLSSNANKASESKRFAFKSLLKRTHSAPKKINIVKKPTQTDKTPSHSSNFCQTLVDKLKNVTDKHSSPKAPKESKPKTVKTTHLPTDKKIVLAEQTKIIRLKDSPKADRKNVPSYAEKQNGENDDVLQIITLDESPGESRKRRDRLQHAKQSANQFIIPSNLTDPVHQEPTVEELLEEELKSSAPKSSHKSKEHIYEDIEAPPSERKRPDKLAKPGKNFANAVLHSVFNKDQFRRSLKKQHEIEEDEGKGEHEITDDKIETVEISSPLIEVQIPVEDMPTESEKEDASKEVEEHASESTVKKETKEEKKVMFSQSTEEYQQKLEAERNLVKEDVSLLHQPQVDRRWSNMSDHEYEPIDNPLKANELSSDLQSVDHLPVGSVESQPSSEQSHSEIDIGMISGETSTPKSEQPSSDGANDTTTDANVPNETSSQQEWHKKIPFLTNATTHTKKLQSRISSQASSLRTKFRRSAKTDNDDNSPKTSGSNLKSNLKSTSKNAQSSPKERKKLRGIDFANKLKAIHMPKMPKAELSKYRLSRRTKEPAGDGSSAVVTTTTTTTTISTIDKFDESNQNTATPSANTSHHPSFSSFTSHFATVPRTASRIKQSIKSKLSKANSESNTARTESEKVNDESTTVNKQHTSSDDLVDRCIQLASKVSMEDEEEELLGILQTKRGLDTSCFDDDSPVVREPRERKPLVHQESDMVSDIDWEECERMRHSILGASMKQAKYDPYAGEKNDQRHGSRYARRRRNDSNFSADETQSSGSSGVRRRIGVIENINDDEFFLRQRSISHDNGGNNRSYTGYSDENFHKSHVDSNEEFDHGSMQSGGYGITRSFDCYDPHRSRHRGASEHEASSMQYFGDTEHMSYYDNDYMYNMDGILGAYGSDNENDNLRHRTMRPMAPKRHHRSATGRESIENNQEVPMCDSELSNKRSESGSVNIDTTTFERYSPMEGRYTVNIQESNGYATVRKESQKPPAPVQRRKRSTKHSGDSNQQGPQDSPYPDRPVRAHSAFAPKRPPRRTSSSSLIEQQKSPSIAASDITQYEEIDDAESMNLESAYVGNECIQSRPLPAPPRPPRDKRMHRQPVSEDKPINLNGANIVEQYDAMSDTSAMEYVFGAEMATQTSIDQDDEIIVDITDQYSQTEETVENVDGMRINVITPIHDDNLSQGIQTISQSNEKPQPEQSQTLIEHNVNRPLTPSAFLIEERITRSPIHMDATLIMHPYDDETPIELDIDTVERALIDDIHIDTDDEKIITAAIRRYQLLENDLDTQTTDFAENVDTSLNVEPIPSPRRRSPHNLGLQPEKPGRSLGRSPGREPVQPAQSPPPITPANGVLAEHISQPEQLYVTESIEMRAESTKIEPSSTEQRINTITAISPEIIQEIIERIRETLPTQPITAALMPSPTAETDNLQSHQEDQKRQSQTAVQKETKDTQCEIVDAPPLRPPSPVDYTPSTDIPPSFYKLRTGISDDESPVMPPQAPSIQKHRVRKNHRRSNSTSDEDDYHRKQHHHHHSARHPEPSTSIVDLSGQLIRACGNALSSTLNTAGNSLIDFIKGLTKNQDEKEKDLSLVLVILIIIVASLMMLGISGDRSIHYHHWDYFNPPDNAGRR